MMKKQTIDKILMGLAFALLLTVISIALLKHGQTSVAGVKMQERKLRNLNALSTVKNLDEKRSSESTTRRSETPTSTKTEKVTETTQQESKKAKQSSASSESQKSTIVASSIQTTTTQTSTVIESSSQAQLANYAFSEEELNLNGFEAEQSKSQAEESWIAESIAQSEAEAESVFLEQYALESSRIEESQSIEYSEALASEVLASEEASISLEAAIAAQEAEIASSIEASRIAEEESIAAEAEASRIAEEESVAEASRIAAESAAKAAQESSTEAEPTKAAQGEPATLSSLAWVAADNSAASTEANLNIIKSLMQRNGPSNYLSFTDNGDGTITVDGVTVAVSAPYSAKTTSYDGYECAKLVDFQYGDCNPCATGILAQRGIVADHFEGLPFGTVLFIEDYGFAVVGDRHGMGPGLLDLSFDAHEIENGVFLHTAQRTYYIVSVP